MAAATTTVALFSTTHHHHPLRRPFLLPHHSPLLLPLRRLPTLRATRRTPPTPPQEGGSGDLFEEGLRWGRMEFMGSGGEEEEKDEEEEEEEEDRSLELLVKFVENVFKRVSRRARKAVRAVLPPAISSKLVGFSVNGAIILAFLWVLKAFLEVVCAMGSVVFISILLIRGVWSGVAYFQENRSRLFSDMEDDPRSWPRAQPG
ncbi:hypothetical protein Droror1_Dr00006108 [Drosera rotundifolia]